MFVRIDKDFYFIILFLEGEVVNILVVDDERKIREMHVQILKGINPIGEVFAASDGLEALRILDEKSVKLVVTDIKMSPMNGLELICEIRKSNQDLIIYVIASDPKDLREALRIGANKIFKKGTGDVYALFNELKEQLRLKGSTE